VAARRRARAGYTLVEVSLAAGILSIVLAVVASVTISVKRAVEATTHYIIEANNGTRLLDYVGRDLERALRVGQLVGSTNSTFRSGPGFSITETSTLTINVPDFYASNTPTNAAGSTYSTSRYARATLGATGSVPWADAVGTFNAVQCARFAPASGSDEIQVRYFRATRSAQDHTLCYFRQEFSSTGTALAPPVETAEQVNLDGATTNLVIIPLNNGTTFQIQSNFTPRFRLSGETPAGTTQLREVRVQNTRRD
jgi:hypothetical protein